MFNCRYCGLWNCSPESPICDEQKEGKPSNHPCRAFNTGDWVEHPAYGVGQVAWVKPEKNGLRITFNSLGKTDWYPVDDIKCINDVIFPAKDMNDKVIKEGDSLYYPVARGGAGNGACICKGIVVQIAKEATHRGYGYYTRQLKIKPTNGEMVFTHNYPANCLILKFD